MRTLIKKLPLTVVISCLLMMIMVTAAALDFGVTYAWLSGSLAYTGGNTFSGGVISVEATMGNISMSGGIVQGISNVNSNVRGLYGSYSLQSEAKNIELTNESNIEIILRVRVIGEWKWTGGEEAVGLPPKDSAFSLSDTGNFSLITSADGSMLLIYIGGERLNGTNYGILTPDDKAVSFGYTLNNSPDGNWIPTVSFIVEALQADEEAYYSGNTAWEVVG